MTYIPSTGIDDTDTKRGIEFAATCKWAWAIAAVLYNWKACVAESFRIERDDLRRQLAEVTAERDKLAAALASIEPIGMRRGSETVVVDVTDVWIAKESHDGTETKNGASGEDQSRRRVD